MLTRGCGWLGRVGAVLAATLLSAASARGLIVAHAENNTAPTTGVWATAGQFFGHVGVRGVGSGVYLGDRWMITANHVGAGAVNFPQLGSFAMEAGSARRLVDPGNRQPTDLLMFRLASDPGLPPLAIGWDAPRLDMPVMLIGCGLDRQPNLVHWNVSGTTWTQVPSGGNRSGYFTASTSSRRWGSNTVGIFPGTTNQTVVRDSGMNTWLFATHFDNLVGEGQGISGDSGGAVLDQQGRLVGLMHGIWTLQGQPAGTSVFGQATAISDLSRHRRQIMLIMGQGQIVPEPASAAAVLGTLGLALRRRR